MKRYLHPSFVLLLALAAAIVMVGCSGSSTGGVMPDQTSDLFTLQATGNPVYELREGDSAGVDIPFDIRRADGYNNPISLSINGKTDSDEAFVSTAFSRDSLTPSADQASVNLRLEVGVLPILPQQREFVITATDGTETATVTIEVNVQPVEAADVYLLMGQSNMVGFGGDGDKRSGAGEPDEPNDRILQLNVTPNDSNAIFNNGDAFTNPNTIALSPLLVRAEDPLHVPLNPDTGAKEENYIGLGMSFAKRALLDTGRRVILVPAAWSGTSFCIRTPLNAKWNAVETSNPALGNTLLFERALARLNLTLLESGGVFRGILWHQGESDADEQLPACSELYQDNIQTLVKEIRTRARVDQRGQSARGPEADIPFVVGTMSRGIDENGSFADYSDIKQRIDDVHRSIDSLVPHSAVSNHDDLVPPAYPCGNDSCIHFGSEALREMGRRYYDALRVAAQR